MKMKEDEEWNQNGNSRLGKKKEEKWGEKKNWWGSLGREREGGEGGREIDEQTWFLDRSGKYNGRRRFMHHLGQVLMC